MKTLKVVLAVLLLCACLSGCTKKEELGEEDMPVTGGFVEVEDGTLTDELLDIFNKALEGYTGMGFTPIKLLATQVVAGTNYKFLADGTAVVPNAETARKIVTVYKDLEGNCSILNVEDAPEEYLDEPGVAGGIVGGFVDAGDGTLTEELLDIFNLALEGYTGMALEPIKLLATQVVAGTNYKFLATGKAVVPNAEASEKIVTIYKDLEGNCSILNVEDAVVSDPVVGGFTDVEDGTLTDELKDIFNKALEGYTGMSLEPVELLATQVVAGTNYKFLATGKAVVPNAEESQKIVTVYKDLEGNCSILSVEDYIAK